MDISVLPGQFSKEFVALARKYKVSGTEEILGSCGFTNYYKPILWFCKGIKEPDNYPVSFSIEVNKKTMKIRAMEIIDENFLQPHFCGDNELPQIKEILNDLEKKGVLKC